MNLPVLLATASLAGGLVLSSCSDIYYDPVAGHPVPPAYTSGHVVHSLPSGYRTVVVSGNRYYHHNGIYYRPRGSSYVVVDRPHGGPYGDRDHDSIPNRYDRRYDGHGDVHVIRTLPRGYREVTYHGNRYYRSNDLWYRPYQSGGYIRVTAPF